MNQKSDFYLLILIKADLIVTAMTLFLRNLLLLYFILVFLAATAIAEKSAFQNLLVFDGVVALGCLPASASLMEPDSELVEPYEAVGGLRIH
jgi:uncharacterized membrane protein YedE/YeeE